MRYSEFVPAACPVAAIIAEQADLADQARKRAEQQVKARKKVADANHKKAEAARQYQDKLRSANEQQRAALKSASEAR